MKVYTVLQEMEDSEPVERRQVLGDLLKMYAHKYLAVESAAARR